MAVDYVRGIIMFLVVLPQIGMGVWMGEVGGALLINTRRKEG